MTIYVALFLVVCAHSVYHFTLYNNNEISFPAVFYHLRDFFFALLSITFLKKKLKSHIFLIKCYYELCLMCDRDFSSFDL